jgi:ABC-2 type transport system permease protein
LSKRRIARRELASLRREKTIVLAVLLQLFIAAFSSFLLVGLVSLYAPGAVPGGIAIGVTGDAGADLIAEIEGDGDWALQEYDSREAARDAFDDRSVDAVFVATERESGVVSVEAIVPDESVRSTVIVVVVRDALQAYERDRREALSATLDRQPLSLPDVPDGSPTFTFTYTVLIPLLAVLPAFISGSIAADTITEELDAGTLSLLLVTPTSAAEIIDGKALATIALAPLQAAAWLALLWANGTAIANPLLIVAFVAGLATILVALGIGIAIRFPTRQSAQLLYSLAVLLVFGLATLLPESPPNTVAKLGLGTADTLTYALVGGYLVVATGAFLAVRQTTKRAIAAG